MKGIILLLLLLFLAGVSQADKAAECRVHQSDSTWCWVKPPKDSCIVNSHWVDTCAVRDSIMAEHRDSNDPNNLPCPKGYHGIRDGSFVIDTDPPTYCYHCYPDTVESDNWLVTWFGVAPLPPPDSYLPRSYPSPLDSAELSDLREMLPDLKEIVREWREKRREEAIWRCVRDYQYRAMTDWSLRMTGDQLEDSCRCLYGGGK